MAQNHNTLAIKRIHQAVLLATFIPFCWLAMQAVHELGHVVAAWLTGGEVLEVVLHPLGISRTDVGTNPHPLVVVWAGPIAGAFLPLTAWALASAFRRPMHYLFRFFAGFCLVANGMYVGFGPGNTGLDTEIMMLHGSTRVAMLAFGLPVIAIGIWLWHGQGAHFGLGKSRGAVDPRAAIASCVLLVATIALELAAAARLPD